MPAQERPVDVFDQGVYAETVSVHPHLGEGGPGRRNVHLGEKLRLQPGAKKQVVLEARVQVDLPKAAEVARDVEQVEVDGQSELGNAKVGHGLKRRAALGSDRDVAQLLAVERKVGNGVALGERVASSCEPSRRRT